MPSDYCVLTLSFVDSDNEIGRMQISAETDVYTSSAPMGMVPKCVISELSHGIQYIDNVKDVDGISPIQVYTGPDSIPSPVLLLENTVYEMEVSGAFDSSFDYLKENSGGDIASQTPLHWSRWRRSVHPAVPRLRWEGML